MVVSGTILIEYKIFDLEMKTTKVTISKLWLVYCVFSIQMCLLSTGQILQSELRVEVILISMISLVILFH